ncbi:short-chain dehydrogenase/reductase [Streptomyces sp. NPDC001393]
MPTPTATPPTDISPDGGEVLCALAADVRAEFFRRVGLDDLLTAGSFP